MFTRDDIQSLSSPHQLGVSSEKAKQLLKEKVMEELKQSTRETINYVRENSSIRSEYI